MIVHRKKSQRRRKAERDRSNSLALRWRKAVGLITSQPRYLKWTDTDVERSFSASRNWRRRLAIVPGDQGKCQSCSAFAVAAAIRIQSELNGRALSISPNYLHTCIGLERKRDLRDICASPNDPEVLLRRLKDRGWSLNAVEDGPYHPAKCHISGKPNRLTDYYVITSVEDAKAALDQGPLIAVMRIPDSFFGFRGSVYRGVANLNDPSHTVCVLGYDTTGWIILNSMGSNWGDGNGCATVPYRMCGLIDFRPGIRPLRVYLPVL